MIIHHYPSMNAVVTAGIVGGIALPFVWNNILDMPNNREKSAACTCAGLGHLFVARHVAPFTQGFFMMNTTAGILLAFVLSPKIVWKVAPWWERLFYTMIPFVVIAGTKI
jgi:hypothetical protein